MNVLKFYDRALAGRRVSEQEFDTKILPGKLRELIKKYEINSNPEEPRCIDLLLVLTLTAKHTHWWTMIGRPLLIAVAHKLTEHLEKYL